MRNYLFIILCVLITSCTSEEIGLIESEDLASLTRVASIENDKEIAISGSALDLLKVFDSFTTKVLRSTDEMRYPDYYGGRISTIRGN